MKISRRSFHFVLLLLFACFFFKSYTTGQVLRQQGVGSLNLTTLPRTTANILKEATGLFCADVTLNNRTAFFRANTNFYRTTLPSLRIILQIQEYFFQPTHVGRIIGTTVATDSALLLVIQRSLEKFEICYRSFSHLGDENIKFSSDAIISWLNVEQSPMPLNVANVNFDSYRCVRTPGSSRSNPKTILLSLRHSNSAIVTTTLEFHYDAIWIASETSFTLVCWEDNPSLNGTHEAVVMKQMRVDRSSDSRNGYLAGSVPFSWPNTNNLTGVCVDVPFPEKLPATPVMFATFNAQENKGNSFVSWVDTVGVDGFRACVTASFWSKSSHTAGTTAAINYMAVLNTVPSNSSVILDLSAILRYQGLSFSLIPGNPVTNLQFTIPLRNYLSEVAGIPSDKFFFVDVSDRVFEETIFFIIQNLTATDAASVRQKLVNKFGSVLQSLPYPTNRSSAEYVFVRRFTFRTDWPFRTGISFDSACKNTPITYGPCSTSECGTSGNQTVDVSGDSRFCSPYTFEQKCNELPCITKSQIYSLVIGLNNNLTFQSGASVLVILLGVVYGLVVLALIGGGIYYYYKGRSNQKLNRLFSTGAVVLGRELLSGNQK